MIGFITPNIFGRKPNRRTNSFLGNRNPRIIVFIFCENPTSVPRCVFCDRRISEKLNGERMGFSFFIIFFGFNENKIAISSRTPPFLLRIDDFVIHRLLQINLKCGISNIFCNFKNDFIRARN